MWHLFKLKYDLRTHECGHFSFNKCSTYTHDGGANAKFSTNWVKTDYSACCFAVIGYRNPFRRVLHLWSTAMNIPFLYSFSGNCAASVPTNFHIHVSVSELYILRIGPHIFLQQNRQIDGGNIEIANADTWMLELGLWPRNSFSGNKYYEFSALLFNFFFVLY